MLGRSAGFTAIQVAAGVFQYPLASSRTMWGGPSFPVKKEKDMKRPYEELGVVNTREVFKKAMEGGYAIPAYNFNNLEQLQAIIIGCAESKSPVILQVSRSEEHTSELQSR